MNMKIFEWEAADYHVFADGYVIAEDYEDAEEKLEHLPWENDPHVRIRIRMEATPNGADINEYGIATRWED